MHKPMNIKKLEFFSVEKWSRISLHVSLSILDSGGRIPVLLFSRRKTPKANYFVGVTIIFKNTLAHISEILKVLHICMMQENGYSLTHSY